MTLYCPHNHTHARHLRVMCEALHEWRVAVAVSGATHDVDVGVHTRLFRRVKELAAGAPFDLWDADTCVCPVSIHNVDHWFERYFEHIIATSSSPSN